MPAFGGDAAAGRDCQDPLSARDAVPIGADRSLQSLAARTGDHQRCSRPGGLLTAARLQLYGYAVAVIYASFLGSAFAARTWIVDASGAPIYTDFACAWVAAVEAMRGHAALLYEPAQFVQMQAALTVPSNGFYPNWPYPPVFFLILAPFALLRYGYAFVAWDLITLLGCIIVVYAIVRRPAAIALLLACPFIAWNFLASQNGFLTASLLGASLVLLEERPILAGVFIGFLTYKPQFGVLLPIALVSIKKWPAIAGAVITTALLAGASAAMFGAGVWEAFPRQLVLQAGLNLAAEPTSDWGYLQTPYGFVRLLHGGAALAWVVQATITLALAGLVWRIWQSRIRYSLKAATLSSAALLATPYAFAYDFAAVAIPAAFLVRDQLASGSLRGEQRIMIGVFAAVLAALVIFRAPPVGITFGSIPIGPLVTVTLLGLAARRIFWCEPQREALPASSPSPAI